MVGLDIVASVFNTIEQASILTFITGQNIQFPVDEIKLTRFLAGYANHDYLVREIDILKVDGSNLNFLKLKPTDNNILSVVVINPRPSFDDDIKQTPREIIIYLNSGLKKNSEQPVLNHCWRRFCLIKEISQAILYEDIINSKMEYPITIQFEDVTTLLSQLNNEHFSLLDFDDEQYGIGLAVENAAELLAIGLLFPFTEALQIQKALVERRGSFDALRSFDYYGIAERYKIPVRYAEVILTWSGLESFVADIERASVGLL